MDEIKTNPPVQNSPAEPPKKVRRVGTMAFAVLLIAGGVLLLTLRDGLIVGERKGSGKRAAL